MSQTIASASGVTPKSWRLLKPSEFVRRGDFMVNDAAGVELLEGSAGFRADSFVKQIYRQLGRAPEAKKSG